MAKKQYKTLEELQTALQDELKKETPDLKALMALSEQVGPLHGKELEAERKKAEAEKAKLAKELEKLQSQIKALKEAPDPSAAALKKAETDLEEASNELAEVKEKLEALELVAKDPNAASMRQINEGKYLEVPVEDKGKPFLVSFQFKRKKFSVPGHGGVEALQVLKNPDRYRKVITRLIERKSPILLEVSRKPLKKGGK